ncbi:MAG: hypothetical protein ACI39E_01080 [Acutalibacteraceae bacterium]
MEQQESAVSVDYAFAVDLTKEEYIDYYMTLSKMNGPLRMQKPTMIFLGLNALVCAAMFVYISVRERAIDWELLLLLVCMVALWALILPLLYRRIRKNAQRLYEQGSDNGYYGVVRVYETGISKETENGTVKVSFSPTSVYLENAEFMAFFSGGSERAIVLPARCLTEEDAAVLRRCVFADTAKLQRRVIKRMTPKASVHIAPQEPSATQSALLTLDFSYLQEELEKLASDTGLRNYIYSLPTITVLSVLMGALTAMLTEDILFGGLIAVAMLLLYLFLMTRISRSRVRRSLGISPHMARLIVSFTDRGITTLRGGTQGARSLLVWESISRAVERKTCVEFFSGRSFLRIPKRCIPDMQELRGIVDAHMPKKGA